MWQHEIPPKHDDTILCDRLAPPYPAEKVGTDRRVVGPDHPFTVKLDRRAQFAEQTLGIARETLSATGKRRLGPDGALAAQRG
jgi:aminocarboxymuconate-semialdehyde decarboxylase